MDLRCFIFIAGLPRPGITWEMRHTPECGGKGATRPDGRCNLGGKICLECGQHCAWIRVCVLIKRKEGHT